MRLAEVLEQRIDRLTHGTQNFQDAHASPESMKRAVTLAGNNHDLRLLRAYEQHLSLEYTPHMIQKVLAAISGHSEYRQNDITDTVFELLSPVHLDSYREVFSALHSEHPSWTPMAQTAARHPDLTGQLVEQAVRGIVEPQEALTVIREEHSDETLRS